MLPWCHVLLYKNKSFLILGTEKIQNSVFVLLHRKGSFWCTESNYECLIPLHSSMVHLTHALPVLIYKVYSRAWQTVGSLQIKSSDFHISWHGSVCYNKANSTLGRLSRHLRYLPVPILCLKMESLDLSLGLLLDFTASLNLFSFSASTMLTWLFLNDTKILKNNKKPQSARLFEESRAIIYTSKCKISTMDMRWDSWKLFATSEIIFWCCRSNVINGKY